MHPKGNDNLFLSLFCLQAFKNEPNAYERLLKFNLAFLIKSTKTNSTGQGNKLIKVSAGLNFVR